MQREVAAERCSASSAERGRCLSSTRICAVSLPHGERPDPSSKRATSSRVDGAFREFRPPITHRSAGKSAGKVVRRKGPSNSRMRWRASDADLDVSSTERANDGMKGVLTVR